MRTAKMNINSSSKLRNGLQGGFAFGSKAREMMLVNTCKCRTGMEHPVLSPSRRSWSSRADLRFDSAGLCRDLNGLWGFLRPLCPQHPKNAVGPCHTPSTWLHLCCFLRNQLKAACYSLAAIHRFSGKDGNLSTLLYINLYIFSWANMRLLTFHKNHRIELEGTTKGLLVSAPWNEQEHH